MKDLVVAILKDSICCSSLPNQNNSHPFHTQNIFIPSPQEPKSQPTVAPGLGITIQIMSECRCVLRVVFLACRALSTIPL